MITNVFNNQIKTIHELEDELQADKKIDQNPATVKKIEDFIHNWEEHPLEGRDETLSYELFKFSLHVSERFNDEQGYDLKCRIQKISKNLLPESSLLLDKYCPNFRSSDNFSQHNQILKLVKNFPKLELNPQERFSLCMEIAAEDASYAEIMATNIDKLGLEKLPVPERLTICKLIAAYNVGRIVQNLAENFEQIKFEEKDREELLAFWSMVAKGENGYILPRYFKNLGLNGIEVSKRLELLKLIQTEASYSPMLDYNFPRLGLLEDIKNCKDIDERFSLCKMIAETCWGLGVGLIKNIDELGLEELDVSIRLAWYKELAGQGKETAEAISKNLIKFKIDSAQEKEKLDFIKILIRQGDTVADQLAYDFDKLGFETSDLSVRIDLCEEIISQGDRAALALFSNFKKFRLDEMEVSERFEWVKKMVDRGDYIAVAVIREFHKLGLEEIGNDERLAFFNEIAAKGGGAAREMGALSPRLGLKKAGLKALIHLCRKLVRKDENIGWSLTRTLSTLDVTPSEQRQLLFDISIPNNKSYLGIISIDISPVRPLIYVLNSSEAELASETIEDFENFLDESKKLELLRPLFNEINKSESDRARLLQWLAYTAVVLNDLDETHIKAIKQSGILNDILHHRDPMHRYFLVRTLSLTPAEELFNMPDESKKKKWSKLSWLLLSSMKQPGFTEQNVMAILKQINEKGDFKDTQRLGHLFQLLLSLIEEEPYKTEEIENIDNALRKTLSHKAPKKLKKGEAPRQRVIEIISKDLLALTNILKILGKEAFFSSLKTDKSYDSFFLEKFQDLFKVEEIENFGDRYWKTFGSFRNEEALYTYLRSVNLLSVDDRESVFLALSSYVDAVLKNNFPDIRYDVEKSPHLKHLFENRKGLKEAWLDKGMTTKIAPKDEDEPTSVNYKELFYQKIIADRHLTPDEFPFLRDYLQGNASSSNLEKAEQDPSIEFQKYAIDLCENEISAEEFLQSVEKLELSLGEFQNDLKSFQKQSATGEYTIGESDEACDLLLIGTEINGSCQRVDGNPGLNKCLAAYLINGEVIPIVVKHDGRPEIVARAMLRLMWDDENNTPTLLLERIYSNVENETIKNAILKRAEQKAKMMGIPLVSKEVGEGSTYRGKIKFLGGFAPYTYSDASEGVMKGEFEVEECHVLFSPEHPEE